MPILGNSWWPLESIAGAHGLLVAWAWPVLMWLQCAIVWLTVLVTLERWVAICRPFDASRLLTKRHSRLALLVLFVVSAIYATPRFFEFRAVYETEGVHIAMTTSVNTISPIESLEPNPILHDITVDVSIVSHKSIDQQRPNGWWIFVKSPVGQNMVYAYGYSLVLYFLLVFLCPVVLLTNFNILLLLELRRLRQRWYQLTIRERREYKVSM